MALAFDTLQAAKQLQKSGFAEPQAEATVSIVSDKHEVVATKSDLEILRIDLGNFREATKTDFENLKQETKVEFKNLSQKIEAKFKNLSQKAKAEIENLGELTQAYGEIANNNKNWLRWGMGLNSAMLLVVIGYLLSQ